MFFLGYFNLRTLRNSATILGKMAILQEAASVLVVNARKQLLFVKRPQKSRAWANMLVFPGGKVKL